MKAKHVAIFDFYSPGDPSWDAIGRQVAADFRARVDATPHGFKLKPYAELEKGRESDGFWQIDLSIADVAAFAIHDGKVDAFVTGSLTPTASETIVNVRLFVYNIKKPGSPTMISTSIPFSPDLKAMLGPAQQPITQLPPYKKDNGVHYPSCIYCPQAAYTDTAVDKKFEGVVTLITTIELNGKAGPIEVVKGLPYGLDAEAISAVRKWRFEPARGLDGQPVRYRQTIEVQFHLY
jgi:TonB family protein